MGIGIAGAFVGGFIGVATRHRADERFQYRRSRYGDGRRAPPPLRIPKTEGLIEDSRMRAGVGGKQPRRRHRHDLTRSAPVLLYPPAKASITLIRSSGPNRNGKIAHEFSSAERYEMRLPNPTRFDKHLRPGNRGKDLGKRAYRHAGFGKSDPSNESGPPRVPRIRLPPSHPEKAIVRFPDKPLAY